MRAGTIMAGVIPENHLATKSFEANWTCPHGKKTVIESSDAERSITANLSELLIVKSGCDLCKGTHPHLPRDGKASPLAAIIPSIDLPVA